MKSGVALVLQAAGGSRGTIRGEEAVLQELAEAIRDALPGPHRGALPPAPPPSSQGWRR